MTVLDAPPWTPLHADEQHGTPPARPTAAPPVHPAVAGVARAQSEGSLACGSLADTAALSRAAESVQGLALRELAAVDTHRTHTHVGRASAAGWLGDVLTLDDTAARARVRLARRLSDDLDRLGDLLLDGGTTVAHTAAVHAGLRGLPPQVVADSQGALVVLAQHLDPPTLARELRERAHAVSDDLGREAERRQRQRAGLQLSELLDGCVSIKGLLTPEDGQALLLVLDAHVRARREHGDHRDAPARRAEALAALAHHALQCEDAQVAGQGGSRAHVLVLSHAETLAGTPGARPATFPASHALLSRQTLQRLTCDADLSHVTLGPAHLGSASAGRAVLDLGRTTRTVTPAQWRALVARDQHCVVRGCRRRPSESQAHHVQHWTRGGPSDLQNYALVCHQHHHELHEGHQTLQHHDGRWLTPDGYTHPRPGPPPL